MSSETSGKSVLLVIESPSVSEPLSASLRRRGLTVSRTDSARRAFVLIGSRPFDLVIADSAGSLGIDGLLKGPLGIPSDLPLIVVGSSDSVETAVEAMKRGAADFVSEAAGPDGLIRAVECAFEAVARRAEQPTSLDLGDALVGDTPAMMQIAETVKRSAAGSATVLIRGETGTGKEVVARSLHNLSHRAERPFIKVHCAALPDALLESELFGHEKGAFTGAVARKPGRIEFAQSGTLFLDEIGDVPLSMQVKLLRVLQDREFERLGGTETLRTDARFCAATHRDLEGMIQRGQFREDLFYRLNVVPVWVPPLRSRRADIDALVRLFCDRFGAAHGKPQVHFDDEGLRALRRERWPGNVRQLQNFVERLIVLTTNSTIGADEVNQELSRQIRFVTQAPSSIGSPASPPPSFAGPLEEQVRRAEREAIVRALDRAKGNRTVTARILEINRRTLYNKMVEYGLGEDEGDSYE